MLKIEPRQVSTFAARAAVVLGTGLTLIGGAKTTANAGENDLPTITERDAEPVKAALLKAIEASDDPGIRRLAADIRGSAAWVDTGGTLYIGQWRLDGETNRLVKRPMRARTGPVFRANLGHSEAGWSISAISVGRHLAPDF